MTPTDPLDDFVAALEALNVPYMVVGSYASNVFGIARSTQDLDFVVILDRATVNDIAAKLPGKRYKLDPQMAFETITGTCRHVLELEGEDFRIELFLLSDDPHYQQAFSRRRRASAEGVSCWLLSPEDVIVAKLRWTKGRRKKDIEDVENVIAVQHESLDWDYISGWCRQHGTAHILDEVKRTLAERGIDV